MKQNKKDLAQWAMEFAIKSGADEAAVSLSNSREIEIEFREKKLEKVKESTQNALSLKIYTAKKYSSHSTNDLRKDALQVFIQEAVASTKYLAADEFRALPDPKYYPKKMDKNLVIRDPNYEKVESGDRVEMAKAIEAAAMAESDQIISTTAGYSDNSYESLKIHSNGFMGENVGTSFWAGAEATVKDGDTGRPADWFYAGVRFHADLPSSEELGRKAVQRALRKVGQKKIASGRYSMIVENRSVSRLLSMLIGPMNARSIQQKRSFLDGKLNQQIASDKLTLIDDPFIEKGFGSRFYDDEGLATKRRVLIDKGVLKTYLVDNYYGRKLGWEPNSSSTTNMMLAYGDQSLEQLIRGVDKGILVTGFIGGNSNATTGDFSYGIVGQLIENGKIVHAVNEMNISGNCNDFFKQLSAVGNDPYPYSSWRMASLKIDDVEFSGI